MKPFVIVTVRDEKKKMTTGVDMEIPTDVPVWQLIQDMEEVLREYKREAVFMGKFRSLYCKRLERKLGDKETFGEAGIWTGDVIIISE